MNDHNYFEQFYLIKFILLFNPLTKNIVLMIIKIIILISIYMPKVLINSAFYKTIIIPIMEKNYNYLNIK